MSNNANPQLTNEQAHQVLTDVANLDQLKLNKKEHLVVQMALDLFKNLVEAAKPQPDKVVELTPAPETPTV